jgi:amidase
MGMQMFASDAAQSYYDASRTPVGRVSPGEKFVVETIDCFGGRLVEPSDYTAENLDWVDQNLNPLTGPIDVEGAEPGQVLAVTVHDVEIITDARFVRSRYAARSPQDWWYEKYGVVSLPVRDGEVWVTDVLSVPVAPVVGCIGTAPGSEVLASVKQGMFGGNMDCNLVRPGSTVELPVQAAGGKLFFGDVKAAMGDGEIVNAAEAGSRITASVQVRPRPPEMTWARVRTADSIAVVVSDVSLAQAGRTAFRELAAWISAGSSAVHEDVIRLLGMASHLAVCQVSNPLHTAHCEVPLRVVHHLMSERDDG